MPRSLLDGSPFPDSLIPGLTSGWCSGCCPSGRRPVAAPPWAWDAAFVVGCGLAIWTLVDMTMVPHSWLQPFFGGVGLRSLVVRGASRAPFDGVSLPGKAGADLSPSAPPGTVTPTTHVPRPAANMPTHSGQESQREASVRRETTRQRVFLTFAAGDLAYARPETARLLAGGGSCLDQALTGEPFASERGDIIRASLLTRPSPLHQCPCLYGARTADDDWVRWALETAAELRLPLLGAALPGQKGKDAERYLMRLGAELIPLTRDAIVTRTRAFSTRRITPAIDAASIAETLHLMRHQVR